jgi:hypothetical protein
LKKQIVGKSGNIKSSKHKKAIDNSNHHQTNIVFTGHPNSKKPHSIMLNKQHYMESPMKNIVVNPKQGGHLFSYNEIKDHKITLNTIRKQI